MHEPALNPLSYALPAKRKRPPFFRFGVVRAWMLLTLGGVYLAAGQAWGIHTWIWLHPFQYTRNPLATIVDLVTGGEGAIAFGLGCLMLARWGMRRQERGEVRERGLLVNADPRERRWLRRGTWAALVVSLGLSLLVGLRSCPHGDRIGNGFVIIAWCGKGSAGSGGLCGQGWTPERTWHLGGGGFAGATGPGKGFWIYILL